MPTLHYHHRVLRTLGLLAALGSISCESVPTVPGVEVISVEVAATPSVVAPGQEFTLELKFGNPTDGDIVLISPIGCVAHLEVRLGDVTQQWEGTQFLCTQATSRHPVPARGEAIYTFSLRARVRGETSSRDAIPGRYLVEAKLLIGLPDVISEIVVREPLP